MNFVIFQNSPALQNQTVSFSLIYVTPRVSPSLTYFELSSRSAYKNFRYVIF